MGPMTRLVKAAVLTAVIAVAGTAVGRVFGYRLGRNTIVRCRDGHLFTTWWIPGVKLKALDLGLVRFQRCPVGKNWTLIRPVREAALTEEEKETAAAQRDIPIP